MYSTQPPENLEVKVNDIDIKQRIIFIRKGKGKKDRFVITSRRFIQDIEYYLKKRKIFSDYLFETYNNRMTVRTAQQILKQAAFRAGVCKRVYPHLLRASFATHLIENDVGIEKIQKLMGHSRIDRTLGYLRGRTSDIKKIESPLDN